MIKGSDFLPVPAAGEPPQVTRFAPSPSGYLHLGHAYSALFGYEAARYSGGRFLLRIEDIDRQRSRPEFEQGIYEDLTWLGIHWDGEVRRQSEHLDVYRATLDELRRLDVVYPCFCSRKQIRQEVDQAGRAPHGPSGEALYPGICRDIDPIEGSLADPQRRALCAAARRRQGAGRNRPACSGRMSAPAWSRPIR